MQLAVTYSKKDVEHVNDFVRSHKEAFRAVSLAVQCAVCTSGFRV